MALQHASDGLKGPSVLEVNAAPSDLLVAGFMRLFHTLKKA